MKPSTFKIVAVGVALGVLMPLSGCSRAPLASPATPPAPGLAATPVSMRVAQRTTTPVPSSDGHLRLTIDDVTHNQVMTSISTEMGETVLAPCSMSKGGTSHFRIGNAAYSITLTHLDNALIGQDFGTFVISAEAQSELSEADKIERLIQGIADIKDATFIRNGAEHSAQEAADHLHLKLRAKAAEITSASQFIDTLASMSSMTGEPYQIRFADGHEVPCGEYLHAKLSEMERPEPGVASAHKGQ